MISLLFATVAFADPGAGLLRNRDEARRYDCRWWTDDEGAEQYPGRIQVSPNRAADDRRQVLVCHQHLLRPGLRRAADEALLRTLGPATRDLVAEAAALLPEDPGHVWLVDAHVPSAVVGDKVAFATKVALQDQGVAVSDRRPVLGATDIELLTRMSPFDAFPAACSRYRSSGALRPGDVLLTVLQLDPRETGLHAGLCTDSGWRWVP